MGFAWVKDIKRIIPAMGILKKILFSKMLEVIFFFYHHREIILGW